MNGPPRFPDAVVIGFGSIGAAHARVLSAIGARLAVVDLDADAQQRARGAHPGATVLGALADLEWDLADTVGVIATWGPSHPEVFEALVARGCRRVLCEKPLADSVERAVAMSTLAGARGVVLGVDYVRRHGREAEGVAELASRFELDEPRGITVHGGSRGLVTNGIHLVEMACDIFGSEPTTVTSTARGEPINPRSPDLELFGGSAIWTFDEGRELVVSLPLTSSLREHTVIYYRDATITVSSTAWAEVRRRPAAEVELHPAVTWTGDATEQLYAGLLPGAIEGDARLVEALRAVATADDAAVRPSDHVRALSACIGALESGATGRAVGLPIDPSSDTGRRRWPIS